MYICCILRYTNIKYTIMKNNLPEYDYTELIKQAEWDVKYYTDEMLKYEGKAFRSRLALEQLRIRQEKQ